MASLVAFFRGIDRHGPFVDRCSGISPHVGRWTEPQIGRVPAEQRRCLCPSSLDRGCGHAPDVLQWIGRLVPDENLPFTIDRITGLLADARPVRLLGHGSTREPRCKRSFPDDVRRSWRSWRSWRSRPLRWRELNPFRDRLLDREAHRDLRCQPIAHVEADVVVDGSGSFVLRGDGQYECAVISAVPSQAASAAPERSAIVTLIHNDRDTLLRTSSHRPSIPFHPVETLNDRERVRDSGYRFPGSTHDHAQLPVAVFEGG